MSLDMHEPITRILNTPSELECSQKDIARYEPIKWRLFLPRIFRCRLPHAVCPGKLAFLHISLHASLSHIWQMKAATFLALYFFLLYLPGLPRMEIRDCICTIFPSQRQPKVLALLVSENREARLLSLFSLAASITTVPLIWTRSPPLIWGVKWSQLVLRLETEP